MLEPRVLASQDIELTWEAWSEHLCEQIKIFTDDEHPQWLYLVVDSRANPGIDKLLHQIPRLAFTSLWNDSNFESYVDIAPYLIQIDQVALADPSHLQHQLMRRLWKHGRDLHALTWIWSVMSLESLGQHLRHFCRYETPEKRAFLLHLYDNRILQRALEVWTEEQASAFLSPYAQLRYLDRDFNEVVHSAPSGTEVRSQTGVQVLSVEQHEALLRLGFADKIAMQLRDMYDALLSDVSSPALWRRVSEQLGRAMAYRINDDALFSYVSKGILVSPTFDEHPFIQERLERAARGQMAHREALSNIDRNILLEASRLREKGR